MRNKLAAILLGIGISALLAAIALMGYNYLEASQAGKQSAQHMSQMVTAMEQKESLPVITIPEAMQTEPAEESYVMNEIQIEGNAYIGSLSLPRLGLELPVISQWSYDKLQIAPCRYSGTMKEENLVLLAHNYDQHFRRIRELQTGDPVSFTDVDGTVYTYQVALQEVLDADAVEAMTSSAYALSLFTCTYDSMSRVVVRCERTEN